ncbi:MAG: WbuC family cupin fold metalloprotein [Steroidobacteraceae bacterium]
MKLLPHALLDELAARAAAAARGRAHHNIHASPADLVQRFIVVARGDSYFRPHRHGSRAELALILRGKVEVVTFDDDGRVAARHAVGAGTDYMAYETPAATWHTVIAAADGAAFLEVKEGPYDPATMSEFAAWAPAEGDPAVSGYQQWLHGARAGESPPGAPPV